MKKLAVLTHVKGEESTFICRSVDTKKDFLVAAFKSGEHLVAHLSCESIAVRQRYARKSSGFSADELDANTDDLCRQLDLALQSPVATCSTYLPCQVFLISCFDPLLSTAILEKGDGLINALKEVAKRHNRDVHFNVVSAMPLEGLARTSSSYPFKKEAVALHYVFHGVGDSFRKRWLQDNASLNRSLSIIKDWQGRHKLEVTLSMSLIKGENDTHDQMYALARAVHAKGLDVSIEILPYINWDASYGVASGDGAHLRDSEILRKLVRPKGITPVGESGLCVVPI